MISNLLHSITDGAAGSPAAVPLKDRSTKSIDRHGGGDDPGPRPDAIRIVQMFRLHVERYPRISPVRGSRYRWCRYIETYIPAYLHTHGSTY